MVLEKISESPLDCKEIHPVHSKGDQSWVFFGRNDAKAETPVLWPLHAKSWLIGKDSDAERDWGQEEKGMTEDEMVGWNHWLDGREFQWTPRVGDGQGGLACCDSWGRKESDTTEWLKLTELNLHPTSLYPAGIAQWPWYKIRGSYWQVGQEKTSCPIVIWRPVPLKELSSNLLKAFSPKWVVACKEITFHWRFPGRKRVSPFETTPYDLLESPHS